jgi:hypothetical protein
MMSLVKYWNTKDRIVDGSKAHQKKTKSDVYFFTGHPTV